MEFFNKKQDVLDIELTSYGKQLLSRGLFKPTYYAFSDDGVLYDQKWMTGTLSSEQQSYIETRIQEDTPRIKTQNRKVGTERGIYNLNFNLGNTVGNVNTLMELFEVSSVSELQTLLYKHNVSPQFAESEKLLENTLGTKSNFNNYNPAWNLLLYNGDIQDSTSYYSKNDITVNVPQINITLQDTVYRMDSEYEPTQILPQVKNIQSKLEDAPYEELYFESFSVEDGQIFIIKDFIFLSLEEQNVNFTKDNFTVEVYEVTTKSESDDGEEELTKMLLDQNTENFWLGLMVDDVFHIEVDDEIDAQIACALINKDKALKDQSIYTTNVFDCAEKSTGIGINVDPYSNLPDVDTGDVC